MLKVRIIPILTFNGFALVKTKQFANPRMVGNPVQAARVYNSRAVDELAFIDIFATQQNRKNNLKIVQDVIKECFMPVAIGGGITSIEDITDLLKIGADKVIIKTAAPTDREFIKNASEFFGAQCITIAVDVYRQDDQFNILNNAGKNITMQDFILEMQETGAGEIILNSVDKDGTMSGFDIAMIQEAEKITKVPMICVGGGGNLDHYVELFQQTNCEAVGSASIFHFTQFTPLDIKNSLKSINKPVRL
ncbi:MAG: imidazole glycerol phosphate synthase subunit HisF [Chitinophagaceae bacterium]|nr:imidazole glycerol phosphate synthase subunit HisF [Chitinophagaceae bacterium]